MTLTYSWALQRLRKAPVGDLQDVVVQTYWTITGTDEDGFSGTFQGATPFKPSEVDPTHFTAFADLTEAQVLGWIKDIVVGPYWDHVNEQIARQITEARTVPTEVSGDELPWASA